jgi:GGDEF domain-containing protein
MKASKDIQERAKKLREAITTYRSLQHEKDESPISPEALECVRAELDKAQKDLIAASNEVLAAKDEAKKNYLKKTIKINIKIVQRKRWNSWKYLDNQCKEKKL